MPRNIILTVVTGVIVALVGGFFTNYSSLGGWEGWTGLPIHWERWSDSIDLNHPNRPNYIYLALDFLIWGITATGSAIGMHYLLSRFKHRNQSK